MWDNPTEAQKIMLKKSAIEKQINSITDIKQGLNDYIELTEIAEGDELKEIEESLSDLAIEANKAKIEALFSGEADSSDCFIEIHAGAGGTESCDWAEMLLRQYLRWCEKHEFKTEIIDELVGDEAGIKSVTFSASGFNAYGWAKTESGVHRLVRISPFDSAGKRHTSFASVWVYPKIDDNIEIEIDMSEVRIDTYRASGAGGQHVNKTDSAVRLTHEPTGIVAQCQNGRSQHKNKAEAMRILKSRLYELELRKRNEEADAANADKTEIGWGNQIRSYVLHPYQMVKDLRTKVETGNTSAVLDGDLDEFIMASLSQKI